MASRSRAAAFAVALAVVGAGCSNATPEEHTSLPPAEPDVAWKRLVLRADDYYLESSLLDDAIGLLEVRCMRRRGFTFDPASDQTDMVFGRLAPLLGYRRAEGYGGVYIDPAVLALAAGQGAGFDIAISGPDSDPGVKMSTPVAEVVGPSTGCGAEAEALLAGSVEMWMKATTLPEDYAPVISEQVAKDPEWVANREAWSACMAERGYDYADSWEPAKKYVTEREAHGKPPTAVEIATAVDDGQCQLEVDRPALVRRLRNRFAEELPAKDKVILRDAAEARAVAVANAREVLGR